MAIYVQKTHPTTPKMTENGPVGWGVFLQLWIHIKTLRENNNDRDDNDDNHNNDDNDDYDDDNDDYDDDYDDYDDNDDDGDDDDWAVFGTSQLFSYNQV